MAIWGPVSRAFDDEQRSTIFFKGGEIERERKTTSAQGFQLKRPANMATDIFLRASKCMNAV